jgi:hypothetical protein
MTFVLAVNPRSAEQNQSRNDRIISVGRRISAQIEEWCSQGPPGPQLPLRERAATEITDRF